MPPSTRMLIVRAATVALTVAVGFLCGWHGHSVTTGITVASATGAAAIAAVGDNGRGCRSLPWPGRRHRRGAAR